jgi:hypothetical protein
MESTVCAYIDPNTSQHVFSLLGPILAFLAAMGGLTVGGLVLVRHRIVSYLKRASWAKRVVTASIVIAVLAVVSVIICRLIW